jgi:hypothetical protein
MTPSPHKIESPDTPGRFSAGMRQILPTQTWDPQLGTQQPRGPMGDRQPLGRGLQGRQHQRDLVDDRPPTGLPAIGEAGGARAAPDDSQPERQMGDGLDDTHPDDGDA